MTWNPQVQLGNPASVGQQRGGLAFPPLVPTSLPVNGGPSSRNHVLGLTRVPNGFLDRQYAGGLCAMYRKMGGTNASESELDVYNFAFHAPTDDLSAYSGGWKVLEAPDEGPTNPGAMAAQRRGQYIYALGDIEVSGTGAFRYQFIDRFHGVYGRERRHHDNAFFYEGLGGAASGGPRASFVIDENTEMFVSDHSTPKIWYLSGASVGFLYDDETTWAWHWVQEDQRGFGSGSSDGLPFYPTHRFKFRFWHYYQNYEKPKRPNVQQPSLVFPWSVGNYGDPELWWFVPERTKTGEFTHRLKIYRAKWKAGQYRPHRGWSSLGPRWDASDPRLVINGGTIDEQPGTLVEGRTSLLDESTNTYGYAFEWAWHNDAHYVGTVGPFRGALFGDAASYRMGEDARYVGKRVIKVMRDPRRPGRLFLSFTQPESVFGGNNWDGAWHAVSNDDGATWSRPKQITPFIVPRAGYGGGAYGSVPSLTVTNAGQVLVPATMDYQGKPIQAFAVSNYTGAIAGNRDRLPPVFRQGAGGE